MPPLMGVSQQEGDNSMMRNDALCTSYRPSRQSSSSRRSPPKSRVDNSTSSSSSFNLLSPDPKSASAPPKASSRKARRSALPSPNAATRDDNNTQRRRHNPAPSRRRCGMLQKMERHLDWGDSGDFGIWTPSTPPEMKIPPRWTPEPPLQTASVSAVAFLPGIHEPTGHSGRNAAARSSQVSNRVEKSQLDSNGASSGASQAADKQSSTSTKTKVQIYGFDNVWRCNQDPRSSADASRFQNTPYKSPCEIEQEASAQRRSSFCRPTAERGNLMRLFALSREPEKEVKERDDHNQSEHKLQASSSISRSRGARVKVIRLNPPSEPKY